MNALRWISLTLRLVAVSLVLLAPFLHPRLQANENRAVMFVVDRSRSVGDNGIDTANQFLLATWMEKGKDPSIRLGAVAFDGRAEVVAPMGSPFSPHIQEGNAPWSSDLAAGIRLAMASLPREGHRTIVVLTDGRPTRGDAGAEIRRASQLGIRVDVVPLESMPMPSPLVVAVRPRATHVAEHQPITIDVDVHADAHPHFQILWTRDGQRLPPVMQYGMANIGILPADDSPQPRQPEKKQDGNTKTVTLVDPNPPPGIHVYEVRAVPLGMIHFDDDGLTSRSRPPAVAAISVEGKAHAAVFSSTGEVPLVLKAALEEAGLEARGIGLDRAGDPAAYTGADLVVLADVRVSAAKTDDAAFTRAAQAQLVDYVQQGGGLFVTGGVFGLAPEYAGTPLARILPVEIEDRGHVEDPPVALAIMLDRSGSMGAPVGSHTKIELAIEASLAAADVLRTTDQLAIGSVDTETHWDVPLGTVDRLSELRAQVRRVEAGGGGIYVYTALKDAYTTLGPVKSPIRHVILFSDTSDSEEQAENCIYEPACPPGTKTAESLAKEARGKGITTTVVGIGEEEAQHTPFLRRLAAAAGGRFYLTAEGADLRRIFLSETRVLAQSNLREKKTNVIGGGAPSHPALEGVDVSKLPQLAAYVETGRRAGADTGLIIPDSARPEGRPMMATWRYGLGKVGAITTDLVEGWGGWASSPVAAQVLRQTLHFVLRQHGAHRADAEVKIKDRVVEVEIELPPDAPDSAAPKAIEVFAIEKSGESKKLAMKIEQRGPGRFVARGRSNGEPIIIARARDSRGALMAEAVGREDHSTELSGEGSDLLYLNALTHLGEGRDSPTPKNVLTKTRRPGKELTATWPYALLTASVLVVLDLLLRRLSDRQRRPTNSALSITALTTHTRNRRKPTAIKSAA